MRLVVFFVLFFLSVHIHKNLLYFRSYVKCKRNLKLYKRLASLLISFQSQLHRCDCISCCRFLLVLFVAGRDVSPAIQQQLADVRMTHLGCQHQGSPAILSKEQKASHKDKHVVLA